MIALDRQIARHGHVAFALEVCVYCNAVLLSRHAKIAHFDRPRVAVLQPCKLAVNPKMQEPNTIRNIRLELEAIRLERCCQRGCCVLGHCGAAIVMARQDKR